MASICRSFRLCSRFTSKIESPLASSRLRSATRSIPIAPRVLSGLGGVESLLPLHSAIASARLNSNIAFDSSCWSLLSLGMAVPL
ncbi:hypothetical protein MLD38_032070 [Melastoma candidum]|uniref:Uncharacterized protein n=1 Tax=Melastoma candidum TaxID=119954 RepID=A0ACB9M2Z7_9MYRT|nr:hypothetical protein MLD38_032070 [Melastoma candidum]